VIVAEDQRFFDHAGFDRNEIGRALDERSRGRRLRGASTISQQVAKNVFLVPSRSLARKIAEAWLTAWLEALWPKRRILEVYLNVAQFGPCLFGAAAASNYYFHADASALSAQEAALLAAILPNPHRLRADEPGPYALARSAEILGLMSWHRDREIGQRLRGIANDAG
jgi:monofunctional biosynthetic peptidoglycan transglycosylase